jgi:hypothetical protein
LVLPHECVFGFGEDAHERGFVELFEVGDEGEVADELGDEAEVFEVFGTCFFIRGDRALPARHSNGPLRPLSEQTV